MDYSFTLCAYVLWSFLNIETDWPIAGQVKVRWNWQAKESGKRRKRCLGSHKEKKKQEISLPN